jgi:hypothetical protein
MSRRKTIAFATMTVVLFVAGYGVVRFREVLHDWGAEYDTLSMVYQVQLFVESHDGRWPTSWDDLRLGTAPPDRVVIRFDVDIDKLLEEPGALESAIVPVTGPKYDKAPHSKKSFQELRAALEKFHLRKTRGAG